LNGLIKNRKGECEIKFERYPTRPKCNNYIVPREIFTLGLCPNELAIYSYLLSLENKDYQCWPSYNTIAKHINVSKNTVKKYINSLYEKQLIWIEPTQIYRGDLKVNGNNKYTIRPIYEVIKYNIDKQHKKNMLETRKQEIAKLLEKNNIASQKKLLQ